METLEQILTVVFLLSKCRLLSILLEQKIYKPQRQPQRLPSLRSEDEHSNVSATLGQEEAA